MVLNFPFTKALYIDLPPLPFWSRLSELSEVLPPGLHLVLLQIKLNSQLSHCASFFSQQQLSNNNSYQGFKEQRALFRVLRTAIRETQIQVKSEVFWGRGHQGLRKTKVTRLFRLQGWQLSGVSGTSCRCPGCLH